MSKKRMDVNWKREIGKEDLKPAVQRYRRYLEDKGLRASTIPMYVLHATKYLEFCETDSPPTDDFARFRDHLHDKKLSRSTINNYSFSIKKYHEMLGQDVSFTFIKPNNTIPYYFDESEITRIFGVCNNIKHLAMLKTIFYASLRASELCSLDDSDVDLKELTIYVRCGKGGKDGLVFITDDCAKTLKQYLERRSPFHIDGRTPLFYTDFGLRWERRSLYRMFMHYKKLAGVERRGGIHVFSRHSMGSLLVKRGCDLLSIKEIMRHSDVSTTMRYLHIADSTKREKYEKYINVL